VLLSTSHVIVDGYNVIHQWPWLKTILQQRGYEAACERLLQKVRVLHDLRGLQLTLIFDGQGERVSITHPGNERSLSCVFSPSDESADTLIEHMVCRSKDPRSITVVTRDHMLAESIGSAGAMVLSPEGLAEWLDGMDQHQTGQLQRQRENLDKNWNQATQSPWKALDDIKDNDISGGV